MKKLLFLFLILPSFLSAQYIEVGTGGGISLPGFYYLDNRITYFEDTYYDYAGLRVEYSHFQDKANLFIGWVLCSKGTWQFYGGNSIGVTLWDREQNDYFEWDIYAGAKYSGTLTFYTEVGWQGVRIGTALKINLR